MKLFEVLFLFESDDLFTNKEWDYYDFTANKDHKKAKRESVKAELDHLTTINQEKTDRYKTLLLRYGDPSLIRAYAKNVIKGRWPEAEPFIITMPVSAVYYARDVVKGRWPEAEPVIMKDAFSSLQYAKEVINGRWPEAEATIKLDSTYYHLYKEFMKELGIKN
jgi:hypothetical protein